MQLCFVQYVCQCWHCCLSDRNGIRLVNYLSSNLHRFNSCRNCCCNNILLYFVFLVYWQTPRFNQEPLVVQDKDGRPKEDLLVLKGMQSWSLLGGLLGWAGPCWEVWLGELVPVGRSAWVSTSVEHEEPLSCLVLDFFSLFFLYL